MVDTAENNINKVLLYMLDVLEEKGSTILERFSNNPLISSVLGGLASSFGS